MIPNNRDDFYRIITRLIDEFMAEKGLPPGSRFQGYAIVAMPGGIPAVIRIQTGEHRGINPEVIDGEREIYVSAVLPPGVDVTPSVAFQPLLVEITLDKETVAVSLPSRIDPHSCSWQVRNGVLDICCRKV